MIRPLFQRPQCFALFWQLFGLALLLAYVPTYAADLAWGGRPFQIVANEKPLPDFFRELAASQGTTAVIDPKVNGTISGKFSGAAQNILSNVCASNGLTWYFDGSLLHIEPANEAKSEIFPIASASASRIAETLARLKISDSRYPITISEKEGTVFASGPKRYMEMVRNAIKMVDQRAAQADTAEIRLFPLKYAWAADFNIVRSGKETSIPGVATVLRNLYGRGGKAPGGSSLASNMPFRMGPSRQLTFQSGETINAPKVEMMGTAPDSEMGASPSSNDIPQFQADTRMNAVLVRDIPARMPQYERLIQSMDVRPRLIEIEATIMDISTDTLDSLGIDWRAHGSRADFQFGQGDRTPLTWQNANTESGQTGSTTPAGGILTVSIGHELRNYLLARVNALTKKGDANFVARPKVLTLDNTQAVLENLNEFFVRVEGFQDAGLFSVTTGTAVRVTPLLIEEKVGRGVMLSIDILDGSLSAESVDQIPIVRRRTINTQALVDEGTSLLIAGYSSEERTNATSGIPVLSNIPILGNLFKFTEKKQVNMERFYMLTPRLVVPAALNNSGTSGS
jgi:type III secretion protein C